VDLHHLFLAGLPAHLCENAMPKLDSVENGRSASTPNVASNASLACCNVTGDQ
jgi:hypothetical protein